MKRSAPVPDRNGHFLTQKRIRTYLQPKEENKPLLTAGLRYAMASAVRYQLDSFRERAERPLICANNVLHGNLEEESYTVAYHTRYFDILCNAFLKMFSSFRRPTEFDPFTGDFLELDSTFSKAWKEFHQKRATLHILCHTCSLEELGSRPPVLKNEEKVLSINDVLKPYKGEKYYEHPWLNIATWGERTNKGNYMRKLLDKPFTLFQKNAKWQYVYNSSFSTDSFETLNEALRDSYHVYREIIKRHL